MQRGDDPFGVVALRQPLLGDDEVAEGCQNGASTSGNALPQPLARAVSKGCTRSQATSNLAITAVGAGLLALPKALSTVGGVLGLAVILVVCFLTYVSARVITDAADVSGLPTYGAIVSRNFGRGGAAALQACIVVHVGGAMVVYLLIIADILVGVAPEYNGVLPELLGVRGVWWMQREFVLLVLVLFVEAPLFSLRSMKPLARAASTCVAATMLLAAGIVGLAVAAAVQGGLAPDAVLWPDAATRAALWGGSWLVGLRELLGSLAVVALAYTFHFNIIPVQRSMADREEGAMAPVLRGSVALCAALYAAVGAAGYALFGHSTAGDVLQNLSLAKVGSIIGDGPAAVLWPLFGAAYACNLLVNFALRIWGLRENLAGLVFNVEPGRLGHVGHAVLTYAPMVVIYGLSAAVPSVWFALELVGSSACMCFAYIFPGLLLMRGATRSTAVLPGAAAEGGAAAAAARKARRHAAGGAALVAIGLVVAVAGTLNAIASLGADQKR